LHTITNDVKKIVKEKKSVKEGESLSALPLFVYFILLPPTTQEHCDAPGQYLVDAIYYPESGP
jgi:hypothetical protein